MSHASRRSRSDPRADCGATSSRAVAGEYCPGVGTVGLDRAGDLAPLSGPGRSWVGARLWAFRSAWAMQSAAELARRGVVETAASHLGRWLVLDPAEVSLAGARPAPA